VVSHCSCYILRLVRKLTQAGNLNVTVADTCFVTCRKTGLKVILHYLEEGWLGKTQNKVQGVIYKCDVDKDKTTRIKDVSDKDIVGRIEGAWHDKVYFTRGSAHFDKVSVSLRNRLRLCYHTLTVCRKRRERYSWMSTH